MKKRFSYFMIAWLLCLSNAMADDITISNVTVQQGGTVDLPVNFSLTSTTDKVGFTFSLGLPTGISLVVDGDGDPIYTKGDYINKFNIVYTNGSFAGQPQNETTKISGTSGTLLTLQLSASSNLEVGSELTVNVTKCTFQQKEGGSVTDINIPDFTFKVTIAAPTDGRTILDELSTTPPVASSGAVDVRVKRTIVKDTWSTICLPFDMTETQVKEVFGDDVELAEYMEHEVDNDGAITMYFDEANLSDDGLMANNPYIIKTSKEDFTEFTVDDVTIVPDEEEAVAEYTNGKTGSRKEVYGLFKGTYHAETVVPVNCLFLYNSEVWYSKGNTKMKAFRAYFDLKNNVLPEVASSQARVMISINENGKTTKIDARTMKPIETGKVYTIAGQYLGEMEQIDHLPAGVYIVNGKKKVIK